MFGKKELLFFLIIILSFLLFSPLLSTYFSQDDFFILAISHITRISDFFHFFIPRSDVQFYRPLGSETFFWISRGLVNWNPFAYHLFLWPFFTLSIFTGYKIAKKILRSSRGGLVIALWYGTSAIHYNTLSWLANSSYIIGTFLFFLSFYIFIYFKSSKLKVLSLSFVYLLALLTNEFAIVLPFVLLAWTIFNVESNTLKNEKKSFIFVGVITLGYAILRFFFRSDLGSYPASFNQSIISSYRFFILYFLNWPETVKDNFLKYWMINPGFLKTFLTYIKAWFLNFSITTLIFLVPLLFYFKNKNLLNQIRKKYHLLYFFLIFWFLISLFPIVIIPSHIAPHHGSISLLPFLILVFLPILNISKNSIKKTLFLVPAILIWIYTTCITIKFDQSNHWIRRRADIARYWIGEAEKKRASIQSFNTVIINKDEKEIRVALFDEKAFQEYFNNPKLSVVYQKESSENGKYLSILLE